MATIERAVCSYFDVNMTYIGPEHFYGVIHKVKHPSPYLWLFSTVMLCLNGILWGICGHSEPLKRATWVVAVISNSGKLDIYALISNQT